MTVWFAQSSNGNISDANKWGNAPTSPTAYLTFSALAAGDIGWNDVGSFNAVYELLPHDPDGNTGRGEALILDSRRCFIDAPDKIVALLGVEDLVVVDTPDALLITRRDRAQDVGRLVAVIEQQGRQDLL